MKSLLLIVVLPVFLVKGPKAETGVANQAPKYEGSMLDNIHRLERTVTLIRGELDIAKADLQTTKAALDYNDHKLKERIEEVANLTKKIGSDKEISFQVKLIRRPYTPGRFEPLKFDDVTLNKGGGYNPTSGIFTVPKNGTYLCWANVVSHRHDSFPLRLIEEGKEIARGWTGSDLGSGTAAITYLRTFKKGEHVWFDVESSYVSIAGDNYSSYGCKQM